MKEGWGMKIKGYRIDYIRYNNTDFKGIHFLPTKKKTDKFIKNLKILGFISKIKVTKLVKLT